MQTLKEVWSRMQATKREQKLLRMLYKDSLESSHTYREVMEELKVAKEKKAAIEQQVQAELGSQYEKIRIIARDIGLEKELLTDVAITQLMNGEQVSLFDEVGNEYEPIFSVRFRKMNAIKQEK